jgi:hypothetical protein
MCNILIYFCNIDIKHFNTPLKHLKHTHATCAFIVMSPCCLDEWRLVVVELDVNSGAWSLSVWQRRGQLTGMATSHEASPLACLLEHP